MAHPALVLAVLAVVAGWVSWWRTAWQLPLRIDHGGVRFGFRKRVPWSDVVGIEWIGPSAAFPDEKAVNEARRALLTDAPSR